MSKADVDKYFPRNGPCMFHSTRYARHRLIDVLRANRRAGDSVAYLARNYRLSPAAVRAAINSTPDDNRMTPKEIAEGKKAWAESARRVRSEKQKKKRTG